MHESVKHKLLFGVMAASVLPIFMFVHVPATIDAHTVFLYLSAIFGYAGLVLLLWMYILGAKSVIGLFFDDLPWVTRVHNWLGKYGTLLVFAHPVFVALAYSENLLSYLFVPSFASVFDTAVTYGRIALVAMLIVWVTSALVRGKIKFRPWKYIHFLAYIALPLSLLHIPAIGTTYESQPAAVAYFYGILVIFVIFSLLRVRQLFGLGKVGYTVISHRQVAPEIMLLKLRPNATKTLLVAGGQYVYLQQNLLGEEHPFSVLDSNDSTGELLIAYKIFGRYTKKMAKLAPNDHVYLDGPYGRCSEVLWDSDAPAVFIAGGIGVTPFVHYLMNANRCDDLLFYAAKSPEKAAFSDTLQKRLGDRYVGVYSADTSPAARGSERGHISVDILRSYISDASIYHYFICGPKPMMQTATTALQDLGVSAAHIHTESFEM